MEQANEQVETQAGETQQVEIDYKAEYEKLQSLTEKQKSEIAGLDKKVGGLSSQYTELLKKTETEAETKQRERQEREEAEKAERALRDKEKTETLSEINKLKVEREALKLGFTEEDIEELGFKDVDSVTKYKAYLDKRLSETKEQSTKDLETALSGARDKLGNNKGTTAPTWVDSAFR